MQAGRITQSDQFHLSAQFCKAVQINTRENRISSAKMDFHGAPILGRWPD
jgi:hypothetical protein